MRSCPLGLLKVLHILQLLLLFESDSATTTARAVAAVTAAYKKGGDDNPAPRRRKSHRKLENRPSTEVIPDAYIILLNHDDAVRNDSDAAAITSTPEAIAKEYGITIEHIYQHAIQGFSSRYVEADILDLMLEDSRIWAVGEDGNLEMEHETDEKDDNDLAAENGNTDAATVTTATSSSFQMQQAAAPEHLDQIDQSMDGRYSYTYTGAGVHIYIMDAGILASHEDFGGRVVTPCFDEIGPCNTDTDSHGTHIASIAGGSTYGVAKGVTIHDTRVYDANGSVSWSQLMSGLDYIAGEQMKRGSNTTVVVNVSLGGGGYDVVDAVVRKTLDTGAVIVVAAGNQAIDACTRTPARVPGVVTVGATGAFPNVRRPSSNYGPCLDIWAPGKDIIAASNQGENQYSTKSGTSMSAPLVVGAIALYIEAGKTVQDLLNDSQQIADLAGTDQSPTRFLSTMKLMDKNMNEEKPEEESATDLLSPTSTPGFRGETTVAPIPASISPSNGPTLAAIVAPTLLPSNRFFAAPTLLPVPGPNLAAIPAAPILPPSGRPTNDDIPSPTLDPETFASPVFQSSTDPSLAPLPIPTSAGPVAPASLQPSPRPSLAPLSVTTRQPSPPSTLSSSLAPTLMPIPVPILRSSPQPYFAAPFSVPTLPPSPVPTRTPVSSSTLAPSTPPARERPESPTLTPSPTRERRDQDSSSTIVAVTSAPAPALEPAPVPDRARYPSTIPGSPFPPPSPPRYHYPTISPQSRGKQPDNDMPAESSPQTPSSPTLVPTQRPFGNFTFVIGPDSEPENEPDKAISSMATTRIFMDGSNFCIMCMMIPVVWLCT